MATMSRLILPTVSLPPSNPPTAPLNVIGQNIVKPPPYRLPTPSSPPKDASVRTPEHAAFMPPSPASISSPVNLGFIPRPSYGAPIPNPSTIPAQQSFAPPNSNIYTPPVPVRNGASFYSTPMATPTPMQYNQSVYTSAPHNTPINQTQQQQRSTHFPSPRQPACETCRKRKRKCDFQQPCGRCIQLGPEHRCVYPSVEKGRYMVNKSKKMKADQEAYRKKFVIGGEKRPIDLEAPRPPGGYKAAAEVIILDDDMPPAKRLKGDNDGWGPGTQIIRNVFPAPHQQVLQNIVSTRPSNESFSVGTLTPPQEDLCDLGDLPIDSDGMAFDPNDINFDMNILGDLSGDLSGFPDNLPGDYSVIMDLPDLPDIPDIGFEEITLPMDSDPEFAQKYCGPVTTLPLTPESVHNSPQDVSEMPNEHDSPKADPETPAPALMDTAATGLTSDLLGEGFDPNFFQSINLDGLGAAGVTDLEENVDDPLGNLANVDTDVWAFGLFDPAISVNDITAGGDKGQSQSMEPEGSGAVMADSHNNTTVESSDAVPELAKSLDEKLPVEKDSKSTDENNSEEAPPLDEELEFELFGDDDD